MNIHCDIVDIRTYVHCTRTNILFYTVHVYNIYIPMSYYMCIYNNAYYKYILGNGYDITMSW